ncbi:three-prime repair exonuclease 1 [Trichonephila clavata]|uniref:Three-prime repair exonuclease 1 n=1 Tax=Trichonephila clavata TaxID=2740835 RepID=A0A8X6F6E4_TRICU|nr:three-prime repair exonuclease 1 [Trichonephila clavata]
MDDFIQMMLPDSGPKQKISTLIFMDLEATGLPSLIGKQNVHITELSLVAVDRTNFENDNTLRVINKLSLCIRPRSIVSPTAMTITGLYNDILQKQEKFDESVPKLMEYFFRRLKQPMCLLAHNGNRYDFPLLQAELKHINYALDKEILCADTLEVFRSIASRTDTVYVDSPIAANEKNTQEKTNSKKSDNATLNKKRSISDDEADTLLSNDMELFTSLEEPIIDEFTTPKTNKEFENIHKPRKKTKLDTTWTPKNQYKATTEKKYHANVKRQLFENNDHERISNMKPNHINSKPTQFSLEKLYYHYFGESPPKSHYAEADCIALSKICQKVSTDFLKWIDEHSRSFNETSAMW